MVKPNGTAVELGFVTSAASRPVNCPVRPASPAVTTSVVKAEETVPVQARYGAVFAVTLAI
jgi:hypothetical protein